MSMLSETIGHLLRGVRPGLEHAISARPEFAGVPRTLLVTSPAFKDEGTLPMRYINKGIGLSPPLEWTGVPKEAGALALIVEDVDSPTLEPVVHAIVVNLPSGDGGLQEGDLSSDPSANDRPVRAERDHGAIMGRNSSLRVGYLTPAPIPGHGLHRYLFQLFALSAPLELTGHPGRSALLDALRDRVLACGVLTGVYERR